MYASEQGTLNAQYNNEILRAELYTLTIKFEIIRSTGAKLHKDGNKWYYLVGELPEANSIVGFGDTPLLAMVDFCKNYGLTFC